MNDVRSVPGFWGSLLTAGFILLLAVVVGGTVHLTRLQAVFSGDAAAKPPGPPTVTPAPSPPAAQAPVLLPLPVDLVEVRQMSAAGALLLDARSEEAYRDGHLPGARSFPLGQLEDRLAAFLQEVPPETPLIVYCSGYDCADSFAVGERLLAEGYRDVNIFEGGVPQWRDAGLPLEREGH